METENATELRKLGMVQLLIEMLQNEQLEPLLAILALNLLTQMSFDDETSIYIRSQAAHLIVRRLFMYHPLIFQTEDEKMQQAFYEV